MHKVASGEPLRIPAATYNAFIDAAEDFKRRQQEQSRTKGRNVRHTGVVLVKNTTGAAKPQCAVVGIDGPIFDATQNEQEFKNRLALKAVAPTDNHKGKFAILAEPLAVNAIGVAWIDGLAVAQVNVTSADHKAAELNGSNLVSKSCGSASILWKAAETGSGTWCVLRLGAATAGTANSPLVLDGTGASADQRTWNVDSQASGQDGLSYQPARLYWSGNVGDPIKLFIRTPKFDSTGRLVAVSAEAEMTIGTGPC